MNKIIIKKLTDTKDNRKLFHAFDKKLANYEKALDSKLISTKKIFYNDVPKVLRSPRMAGFVAYINKNPIAYIVVKIRKQPEWYGGGYYGYLETMYVDENARGKGVATKLFLEAKKWLRAKGVRQIKLRVFSNNTEAIKLYKKWGFEDVVSEMRFVGM